MLTIVINIKGVDYVLPDPINEASNKRLTEIKEIIIRRFKPVVKTYPNAKIIVRWEDDLVVNQISYVSPSVPTEEIFSILNQSGGDLSQN